MRHSLMKSVLCTAAALACILSAFTGCGKASQAASEPHSGNSAQGGTKTEDVLMPNEKEKENKKENEKENEKQKLYDTYMRFLKNTVVYDPSNEDPLTGCSYAYVYFYDVDDDGFYDIIFDTSKIEPDKAWVVYRYNEQTDAIEECGRTGAWHASLYEPRDGSGIVSIAIGMGGFNMKRITISEDSLSERDLYSNSSDDYSKPLGADFWGDQYVGKEISCVDLCGDESSGMQNLENFLQDLIINENRDVLYGDQTFYEFAQTYYEE